MNLPLRVLFLLVLVSVPACGDPPIADLMTPTTPSCGAPGLMACPTSRSPPSADDGVTCRKDSDCVAPATRCEDVGDGMAQCLTACATNDGAPDPARCPGDTVCMGGYPLCVAGCSADAECRATERCVSGACVATSTRVAGRGGGSPGAGGGGGAAARRLR